LSLFIGTARADNSATPPLPTAAALAEAAAKRFPQPVRVGDLLKRRVLQPAATQPTLGWVHEVVKQPDGTIAIVVDYGGVLGLMSRPIAVPADGMTLLGVDLEVVAFSPEQLDGFKTFDAAGATPLEPDATIRMGLSRPSH
jgi:hypothetical protein